MRAASNVPALGTPGIPTLLGQSFVPVSAPNDTNEDTLATINIPANTIGPNGSLRIRAKWLYTNSANNKTLRLRYSGGAGTTITSLVATTTATSVWEIYIGNQNATNVQGSWSVALTGGSSVAGPAAGLLASAIDTTAATSLVFTGQKALNTETLTLEAYTVEVIR